MIKNNPLYIAGKLDELITEEVVVKSIASSSQVHGGGSVNAGYGQMNIKSSNSILIRTSCNKALSFDTKAFHIGINEGDSLKVARFSTPQQNGSYELAAFRNLNTNSYSANFATKEPFSIIEIPLWFFAGWGFVLTGIRILTNRRIKKANKKLRTFYEGSGVLN